MNIFYHNKFLQWKLVAVLLFLIINVININNPILEQHSFRQTQTAISIFYLIRDGFSLSYITPVIGQPYSIPFEFPIFHFIVAFLTKHFGFSLDIAGRLVSLFFALGSLTGNDLLLKELGVDKKSRLFAFVLIVCSPIFLFWSGTFMIESAALFFSISSLFFAAKYFNNPRKIFFFLWFLLITLAILQKVTTALLPYLFGCLVTSYVSIRAAKINLLKLGAILFSICIPLALGYCWVMYSDSLKGANPVAVVKLTSAALGSWNYGSLAQRFSSSFWITDIYLRALAPTALMGAGIGIAFWCMLSSSVAIKTRFIIGGFLSLYFLPQLIFTNLFIVHNYYHYAVIIYLCNIVAISYTHLYGDLKRFSIWLLLATCICSLIFFAREYRHAKFSRIDQSSRTLAVSHEIKSQIGSEDIFVLFGYDWSSEVAYYSERKSLTVPEWYLDKLDMEHLDRYFDKAPKMIVICNNTSHQYDSFIARMPDYQFVKALQDCSLYKQRN